MTKKAKAKPVESEIAEAEADVQEQDATTLAAHLDPAVPAPAPTLVSPAMQAAYEHLHKHAPPPDGYELALAPDGAAITLTGPSGSFVSVIPQHLAEKPLDVITNEHVVKTKALMAHEEDRKRFMQTMRMAAK